MFFSHCLLHYQILNHWSLYSLMLCLSHTWEPVQCIAQFFWICIIVNMVSTGNLEIRLHMYCFFSMMHTLEDLLSALLSSFECVSLLKCFFMTFWDEIAHVLFFSYFCLQIELKVDDFLFVLPYFINYHLPFFSLWISEHISMRNVVFAGKLEKSHASCLSSLGEIRVHGLMVMGNGKAISFTFIHPWFWFCYLNPLQQSDSNFCFSLGIG